MFRLVKEDVDEEEEEEDENFTSARVTSSTSSATMDNSGFAFNCTSKSLASSAY